MKVFKFNPDCLVTITTVATDPQKNKAWPQQIFQKPHRNPCQKWEGGSSSEQSLFTGVALVRSHGIKWRHR